MHLIRECCPALTDDEKIMALQRLMSTTNARAEIASDTALKALRLLDHEDDRQMFSNLRDRLEDVEIEKHVVERFGAGRASKQFATPQCLKDLRPDTSLSSNSSNYSAVLVWQISAQAFQGYYPNELGEDEEFAGKRRQKFMSCSRKYVGETVEEKFKALQQVVAFLWREHLKQGGSDTSKPSKDAIFDALLQADADLQSGACSLFDQFDLERVANLKSEDASAAAPAKAAASTAKKDPAPKSTPRPLRILGPEKIAKEGKKKRKKRESSDSSLPEQPIDFDAMKKAKARKKK